MTDDSDETGEEEKFQDPDVAINRVYTGRGDEGLTSLVGGQRVSKASPRILAYGNVDELNAQIGAARQTLLDDYDDEPAFDDLGEQLLRVQHELFNLGSLLATKPEDIGEKMPRVTEAEVDALEESIDAYNEDLPELRSFVLPGGSRLNVELHRARTICRRSERAAVRLAREEPLDEWALAYLNRLGDALFVWARWAAITADAASEVNWEPNLAASATESESDDGDET